MTEVTEQNQREKIGSFLSGYKAVHVLNIGARTGILQALNEATNGLTASDISSQLGLHEPYVKIWCQTAYHFEILDCDDQGRFVFQPFLDGIIGDGLKPMNMLGPIDLAVNITGERLRNSIDYYRTGKSMDDYSPERSRIVASSTKDIPPILINLLSSMPDFEPIKQLLDTGCKFLDIGCGAGTFISQLAQTFPNSTFMGVDPISHSIELGQKQVVALGLENSVFLKQMGGEEITFVDEFQVASMVLTLHEIPSDIRFSIVENAYQALTDSGKLLILDFSYPELLDDFRNPANAPAVIDQFDETALGIQHLTDNEVDEMLTEAGFKDIQRPMRFPGAVIITASK